MISLAQNPRARAQAPPLHAAPTSTHAAQTQLPGCGCLAGAPWWGSTWRRRGTCCQRRPGRSGGYRRQAHGGYGTRPDQCPRTRQPSGGQPWRRQRTPGGGCKAGSGGETEPWSQKPSGSLERSARCGACCPRAWRLFLAMLVWVICTMSGRMGAVNTAGRATDSSQSARVTSGRAAIVLEGGERGSEVSRPHSVCVAQAQGRETHGFGGGEARWPRKHAAHVTPVARSLVRGVRHGACDLAGCSRGAACTPAAGDCPAPLPWRHRQALSASRMTLTVPPTTQVGRLNTGTRPSTPPGSRPSGRWRCLCAWLCSSTWTGGCALPPDCRAACCAPVAHRRARPRSWRPPG